MNKVLIIESDEDTRYLYQIALKFQNFEIDTASSTKEGLSILCKNVPDLILLDMLLPDLPESHFVESVKEIATKHMPVIILTDLHDGAAEQEAAIYGACDYIDKGKSVGEIISTVRKVIKD